MKKIVFVFLFLYSVVSVAQDISDDQALDSISTKFIAPAIYVDYGKLITIPSNFETKIEGAFELIMKDKWQVITEIGFSEITPQGEIENGSYAAKGNYVRFGFGFLPHTDASSRIGIGVRFASSSFQDKTDYNLLSPSELQADFEGSLDRRNLSANWWEGVFYSDKSMNKWITIGFQLRFRFLREYDSFDELDVIAIPGYGRAENKNTMAVNLFLKFTPFN